MAKMTKAQARKRLNEANRKVWAVLMSDLILQPGGGGLTPKMVDLLFRIHNDLRKIEDKIK